MTENEVQPVSQLVDYQKDSIVSRTIIENEGGTVTAFAYGEGQGVSEHSAPYQALLQVLEGQAEVKISEELHRLEGGEFILIPANSPHSVEALSRFKMLLVMIRE